MLAWVIVATFVQTQPNAYSGQHEVYPQSQPKQQRTASGRLTIPLNSRLLGTASLGEIREFPEERQQSNIQRVVGVEATDQSYESDRSYGDVVAFFDREFQGGGFQLQERTVRPHSTLWTVKRPDGMLARVAVRNTTPTTFEVVEAAGEG